MLQVCSYLESEDGLESGSVISAAKVQFIRHTMKSEIAICRLNDGLRINSIFQLFWQDLTLL